ncbi:MAG: HAMP domain-containing sensor histidine kinase [Clostridium sp.]|uniref:sensor histidine kinase n=1 Tax=Clostridium sp. TaxID=1506 RepID=UPI00302C996D
MLDTKLKSNKDKIFISIISILIVMVASLGMIVSYPSIKKIAEENKYNPYEQSNFLSKLNDSNNGLYYMMKSEIDEKVKVTDIFINKDYTDENNSYYNNAESYERELKNSIYSHMRELNNGLRNLEYYAIDKDSEVVLSRSDYDIGSLIGKDGDSDKINELSEIYGFYIVIDYDEKGKASVKNIKGADSLDVLREFIDNEFFGRKSIENMSINTIKNATFVYGIPKDFGLNTWGGYQSGNSLGYYIRNAEKAPYADAGSIFITIATGFILLCAFLIPYKKERELIYFDKISRIPLELHLIVGWFTALFIIWGPENMIFGTVNGNLTWFFGFNISQLTLSNNVTYLLNLIHWFICFGLIFIYGILIKYIFAKGFLRYIRENTIISMICRFIRNNYKNISRNLTAIDLKEKNTKKIVKILGINLIILIIMCSMWFFGIILAIVYSFILFKKANKHYYDISSKYKKLCDITNEISGGNLDMNIDEDLGVFDSLKEDLGNIQTGFKKAVEEEVKSERMKTDLISNVSHDLKTPLTSIITYVDLLKNNDLTEADKKLYLDTLEKKAQRLQDLIEDLFEVSKATSGNIILNIVDVEVVSLMKQTLLELSDKIENEELIVRSNFPNDKVMLSLDSQRMFRVFENLIINITKYAMKGSRVYIDIIDLNGKVEIILKNMSATEIDFNVNEITDRFVQGDKSRNTKGAGLGLAIAKSFVELQGGTFGIDVDGDLFKVKIQFNKNQ